MKVATLFSGIGAPEWALKRLGYDHTVVLACDNGDVDISKLIDRTKEREIVASFQTFAEEKAYVDQLYVSKTRKHNFVKDSYLANYPKFDEKNYFLDVTLLNGKPLRGQVDLLIGGSPCQAFSTVGFQQGLKDNRGNLFFEFLRLVDEIKPRVFIYENVTGIYSKKRQDEWNRMWETMQGLGYVLWDGSMNAKDYGIPQVRNRFFVVGFLNQQFNKALFNPQTKPLAGYVQDFLIDSTQEGGCSYDAQGNIVFSRIPGIINPKYYLTPAVQQYVMTSGTKNWRTHIEIDKQIARTLLSTMGNHHRAGVDNYVTTNGRIRALSERECLRLMGFTDDFQIVVSTPQMYKQAGNSMVVDVLMSLLAELRRLGEI